MKLSWYGTMLNHNHCRLRAIVEGDLEKVLEWRNSERIRSNMYTDHQISLAEHTAWFENLKQQTKSRYLIFECQNRPVGLVYFTDIDTKNSKSNWGFYLGEENLPQGAGTALGVLGIAYAFMQLNIRKLCGEVFAFNTSSIRFHKKLGFFEEGRLVKHVLKNGNYEDVFLFALFKEDWQNNRHVFDQHAFADKELPA